MVALIESKQIPLGSTMPSFTLDDASGIEHDGYSLYGHHGLLVGFLCNHCPYAVAVWPRFVRLAAHAKSVGINAVAINPNINPDYPQDAPERMLEKISAWNINFPYLVDGDQETARAFKAQCTPDTFLFNGERKLVYHGRVDDNWKDEDAVTQEDLKTAIDLLAAGGEIDGNQKPSMGCSIKWCD